MGKPEIDVLTLTASDARVLLEEGKINSVGLVKLYLAQIAKHNHQGAKLNAIILIHLYGASPENLRTCTSIRSRASG